MMQPHRFANIFMLFLVSFNALITLSIGTLYWQFWHGSYAGQFLRSPWFLVLSQVVGLLLPFLLFSAVSRARGEYIPLPKMPLGPVNIVIIICISLFIQPLMMLVSGVASLILPNPVPAVLSDIVMLPLPVALAVVALTPAICEELVFRGFIQSRYGQLPVAVMALVNGLFFGIIHMNLHQFSYAFLMGILFAYMVYFTRSIFAAMLAHFVVNGAQLGLAYISPAQLYPIVEPNRAELIEALTQLSHLAIFVLPLVAGLFYVFITYNRFRRREDEITTAENRPRPYDMAFWGVLILYSLLMIFVY